MEYLVLCVILILVLAAVFITLAILTLKSDFILSLPDWSIFSLLSVTAAAAAIYGYFFYSHARQLYSASVLTLPAAAGGLLAAFYLVRHIFRSYSRGRSPYGRGYLLLTESAAFLFSVLVVLAFSAIYFFCHFTRAAGLSLTPGQLSYLDYHLSQIILITIVLSIITDIYRIYALFYKDGRRFENLEELSGKELRNLKRRIRAGR